jgi:uncharacterized Rmd1/YagE family protein
MTRTGKISMSREQLSMKMGELFLKKNAINLHTDLLVRHILPAFALRVCN